MATKSSRVSEEEKKQIIEMYANGTGDSVYSIVNKTGRMYRTIQKVLKDAGVYVENQDWLKNHQGTSKPVKTSNAFKEKKESSSAPKSNEGSISIDSFMSKLTASNIKSQSMEKKKSNTNANKYKYSKREKTEYCNRIYGEGNWHFMTADELRRELRKDLGVEVS